MLAIGGNDSYHLLLTFISTVSILLFLPTSILTILITSISLPSPCPCSSLLPNSAQPLTTSSGCIFSKMWLSIQLDLFTLLYIINALSCCSVTQLCLTLCGTMDCSMPGFPVLHHLPELAQTPVHQVSDGIQPSYPLPSPSPPAFNLSQHQVLFRWICFLHQVAKVLELQLPSSQWIFRVVYPRKYFSLLPKLLPVGFLSLAVKNPD